jgi:hypothetical protein
MGKDNVHEVNNNNGPRNDASNLNLVNIHGGDNRNNNANRNDNANFNSNANRNDNTNLNSNANWNSNSNRNDNTNVNQNDIRNNVRTGDNTNTNVMRGGDQSVRTGNQTSVAGANSDASSQGGNSVINNSSKYYGGSAYAPSLPFGGQCSTGDSFGVHVLGSGVSFGKSKMDEKCLVIQQEAATLAAMCRSASETNMGALQAFELEAKLLEKSQAVPAVKGTADRVSNYADAQASQALSLSDRCMAQGIKSELNVGDVRRPKEQQ